jgi:UDP-N-acetylmuramoyl-tripeptide--D-alanyl-D-alanine ligase
MATPLPPNHARFTLEEILSATGGTVLHAGQGASVEGVSTDSRQLAPGNAFVALRGERFDGHSLVAQAAAAGAVLLVVSRGLADLHPSLGGGGATVVRVDDTLLALGALGRSHRVRWGKQVIGITGSAGKTTTRQAIAALLEGAGERVHASEGNLNNAVGVPVVLLGLRAEHNVAVVEIGTSSRGEIAYGASLARPDVSVLTLVAPAHSEGIGTVDDIAVEKGALAEAVSRGGLLVVNGDDPRCVAQSKRGDGARVVRHGVSDGLEVQIVERVSSGVEGQAIRLRLAGVAAEAVGEPQGREISFSTPLLGVAGAYACAAAVGIAAGSGRRSAFAPGVLTQGFAALAAVRSGRLAPVRLRGGAILIDDSYNANPASMRASAAAAAEIAGAESRRLVLVLGEMRELGPGSDAEHAGVGRDVGRGPAAAFVVVGVGARPMAVALGESGRDVRHVADATEAARALGGLLREGDVILLKGSRGVGLDAVARGLLAEYGGEGPHR